MHALTSFAKLVLALLAAALTTALCLAPIAGLGGMAIARTDETMRSNLADLTHGDVPGVTTITDITGAPIAWIYNQRRYEVPSQSIAQSTKDALVSTEDRRFYEHEGVDMQGFARAMVTNLLAGGVEQGASTINQQYVKNYLWLIDAKTDDEAAAATAQSIPRKLREMRMASDLDKTLTKDDILTRYLNLVSFGNHAYGIEAAARTYFGKPAAQLNVPESALLVGMLQSVEYLNPYTNPEGALGRRSIVLTRMADQGYITHAEADAYSRSELGILEVPDRLPDGCIAAGDNGFFCDYALRYLDSKGLPQEDLERGSYTITTTLDPQIQASTVEAIRASVSPNTHGVAGVLNVIRPGENSRDIVAMSSSRYYGLNLDEGQTIWPQPTSMVGNGAGSVFKIFTAAVALEQGMGLETRLNTPPRSVVYGMGGGGARNCPAGAYCVENAGTYAPELSLQDALAQSPNTTFVELIQKVGVRPTVDMAVRLGLRSYKDKGTYDGEQSIAQAAIDGNMGSFTLGPTAVNALELSNVAATIASGGRWCEPNPVVSVKDSNGNEVFIQRPDCEQAISPDIAGTLAHGMSEDIKTGTAERAAKAAGWTTPVAAKTGTTESHQSSAFLAFTRGIAGAPYIFNDGTQTTPLCTAPVRQCAAGTLFGGNEAADAWFRMANSVPGARDAGLPPSNKLLQRGTKQTALDKVTGINAEEAKKVLEREGFIVILQNVKGNGVARGNVVSAKPQDPMLRPGSLVTLNVSDGTSEAPANTSPTTGQQPTPPQSPMISQQEIDELTTQIGEARDALNSLFLGGTN
ncbi:transglycosylase domain-containing protein [Corynebacterium mayonis]|uniref:transglycosylase domain-containing protein n=1 Tax=Corynebacterium mayonis TaxID=3062461 RepID=UPI0031409261